MCGSRVSEILLFPLSPSSLRHLPAGGSAGLRTDGGGGRNGAVAAEAFAPSAAAWAARLPCGEMSGLAACYRWLCRRVLPTASEKPGHVSDLFDLVLIWAIVVLPHRILEIRLGAACAAEDRGVARWAFARRPRVPRSRAAASDPAGAIYAQGAFASREWSARTSSGSTAFRGAAGLSGSPRSSIMPYVEYGACGQSNVRPRCARDRRRIAEPQAGSDFRALRSTIDLAEGVGALSRRQCGRRGVCAFQVLDPSARTPGASRHSPAVARRLLRGSWRRTGCSRRAVHN